MADSEDEQRTADLLRLDDLRCDMTNRGDVLGVGALLADDLIHIHASGHIQTKAEFLRDVAAAKRPRRTRGEREVRHYGDAAVMTGPQYITMGDRSTEVMVTQVWVFRSGGWQQASFHASRAEPA